MKKLEAAMDVLYSKLSFFKSNTFYIIFSVSVLLNPIAVWFQAYKAWFAVSTDGISAVTFSTMLVLQSIGVGYSIRVKEPILLLAMGVSAFGTIAILLALTLR